MNIYIGTWDMYMHIITLDFVLPRLIIHYLKNYQGDKHEVVIQTIKLR